MHNVALALLCERRELRQPELCQGRVIRSRVAVGAPDRQSLRPSARLLGGGARRLGAEAIDGVDAVEADERLSGRSVARLYQPLAERAPQMHGLISSRLRCRQGLALLVCHARIVPARALRCESQKMRKTPKFSRATPPNPLAERRRQTDGSYGRHQVGELEGRSVCDFLASSAIRSVGDRQLRGSLSTYRRGHASRRPRVVPRNQCAFQPSPRRRLRVLTMTPTTPVATSASAIARSMSWAPSHGLGFVPAGPFCSRSIGLTRLPQFLPFWWTERTETPTAKKMKITAATAGARRMTVQTRGSADRFPRVRQ